MELSIKAQTSQVYVGCTSVPIVVSSLIPSQLQSLANIIAIFLS